MNMVRMHNPVCEKLQQDHNLVSSSTIAEEKKRGKEILFQEGLKIYVNCKCIAYI